jgi:excisionase family DNA binding protein
MTKLLKVEDIAEQFNMTEERIYTLAREGILPVCRIGRQLRFSENAITEFVENGGKAFSGGWRKEK